MTTAQPAAPLPRPRMQGLRDRLKAAIPSSLLVRDLGPGSSRSLLLTFDDGPHPETTAEVLARLRVYDAKAVFFMIGERIDASPTAAANVAIAGHRLGNHTYSHRAPDPWLGAYLSDVRRCQQAFQRHVGVAPTLFRAPKGHLSATSLLVPKALGLRAVNWSLNVRDWACESLPEALNAAERLVRYATPGDIVLLHDDRRLVLPLLDFVLPRLTDAGFDLSSGVDRL